MFRLRHFPFVLAASLTAVLLPGLGRAAAPTGFKVVPLVADTQGVAAHTDPNLVNPWGVSFLRGGPFWVANNETGTSTLYNGTGVPQSLVVTIPPAAGGDTGHPTGTVANTSTGFNHDLFIFAGEDGTISGWGSGNSAVIRATVEGAIYKGLALVNKGAVTMLLAANFHANRIDAFNTSYGLVQLPANSNFTDPNEPAGYAPFNVAVLNGSVFVSYAKQDDDAEDDVAGAGNGFVDLYTLTGHFVRRLVSGTSVGGTRPELNSPWGMAIAPAGFGKLQKQLLVGNFGSGQIGAYSSKTGKFIAMVTDSQNQPLAIDGLWTLVPGGGGQGGDTRKIYFTAGPDDETHGLFGDIEVAPKVH